MPKKALLFALLLSVFGGVLAKQANLILASPPVSAHPITPVLPITPILPITPVKTLSLTGTVRFLPNVVSQKGLRHLVGTPSQTIQVEARNTATQKITAISVDTSGRYSLNLVSGKYIVQVRPVEGYSFAPKKHTVTLNKNQKNINFLGLPNRKK